MRRIICAILFLLIAGSAVPAQAQHVELKLARILSWQKKYDEAIKRYESYLATRPGDARARMELGDICLSTGRYECARDQYSKISRDPKLAAQVEKRMADLAEAEGDLASSEEYLKRVFAANPEDAKVALKLARVLSYRGEYGESIALFDAAIAANPKDSVAISERADVLSWEERYEEAVAGYDASLAIRFDADVARQKARVLGWWKKFGRSIEAYDWALEESKIEAIGLERDGKRAFWNRWVLTSLDRYRELLDMEPGNVEARFDLAQVEGYQRMWKSSASNFSSILDDEPWHFRAKDSLEKVKMLRNERTLVPYLGWFRARSDDRDTHVNRFTARASISQPVADHANLLVGYAFDEFLFDDFPSISRHQGRIGGEAWLSPRIWGNAYYLPTGYPYMNRMSQLFEGELSARPVDPVTITAFGRRDDMTNQRIVFDKKLHTTNAGGRMRADIHRRWVSSLEADYSWINDTNRRWGVGASELFYLSYEPHRLTLNLKFDLFSYRFMTTDYWSPKNYWSTEATLHWRHYLNPHGMYFGALERYYGIKFRFQIDRGIYPFNGGAVEFHYDFNRRIGLHFEARGGKSSVYYDIGSELSLTARF